MVEWPARLPGMEWLPSPWNDELPLLAQPPILLVLHSAETHPGIAEFCHKTGYVVRNGKRSRVCYHVAWSVVANAFVQQVDLTRQAWHGAGPAWERHPRLRVNGISLGWCLPGPFDSKRSPELLEQTRWGVSNLVAAVPSLTHWIRHDRLNPAKRDPGPGVPEDLLDGVLRRG